MVIPPQEGEIFLHGYDIFFFLILASFHIQKKLLKVSDHSVEEIQRESTTLIKYILSKLTPFSIK